MPVSLRAARTDDEEFLFQLFCQTMGDGLISRDAPQFDAILRLQFRAQLNTYLVEFPNAEHQIIMLDGVPIGRVLVERGPDEHRGVDIALVPEHRGSGLGTVLIQELLDEAELAGKPFRISVVRSNPAMHLYERLGFKITGETLTHFWLQWTSDSPRNND